MKSLQCTRERIERLIRASAAGQNAKFRLQCTLPSLCIHFQSVVSGKTFACVIELTPKKIKVLNAQINLPKLHTKYQSNHNLSKNSHVHDRWFQTQTATTRQWYVLRRWTWRISKYLLCSAPLWPLPLRADDNVLKKLLLDKYLFNLIAAILNLISRQRSPGPR